MICLKNHPVYRRLKSYLLFVTLAIYSVVDDILLNPYIVSEQDLSFLTPGENENNTPISGRWPKLVFLIRKIKHAHTVL